MELGKTPAENVPASEARSSEGPGQVPAKLDPAGIAMTTGLNLAKRAAETESLDHLLFFLTNDVRSLLEFDRCFLILHLGGQSYLAGSNNQPTINTKSRFVTEWNKLAPALKGQDKVVFISSKLVDGDIPGLKLPDRVKTGLRDYMAFSGCAFLLSLPLVHRKQPVGHLVFEFLDAPRPDKNTIGVLLTLAPSLAAAVVEKWVAHSKPEVLKLIGAAEQGVGARVEKLVRRGVMAGTVVLALLIVLFLIPVTFTVGGEMEIVPEKSHMAFSKLDGIIEQVFVKEGDPVSQGQRLATLNPTDMEYEIMKADRQIQILDQEIAVLGAESADDASKWAKKKLAELKRKGALEESQYLKWKQGFLDVASPVAGVVITKDVQGLIGKSLIKGEPFCEIAVHDEMCAEVRVPEERISYVCYGQKMLVYLNTNPSEGYELRVQRIAPHAAVLPRLGNVFAVSAPFDSAPAHAKIGMKGIGKIETNRTSIWFILTQRLQTRINQMMIHL